MKHAKKILVMTIILLHTISSPILLHLASSAQGTVPEIAGWGGSFLPDADTNPSNPASQVFSGEQASNMEMQVLQMIKKGENGVRASFEPSCAGGGSGLGNYDQAEADRAVAIAQHFNFWVLLDYHGYDELQTPTNLQCWLSFWKAVVNHFKGGYSQIVYEPINEPNGISVQTLSSSYQQWINQARSLGDTHWIVVENLCSYSCTTPQTSSNVSNIVDSYPNVTDTVHKVFISLHAYMFYNEASSSWNTPTAELVANNYYQAMVQGQTKTGWPSLNTEGGAVPSYSAANWPPDGQPCGGNQNCGANGWSSTTLHFIQTLISLLDHNTPQRINWIWWPIGSWGDTQGAGILGAIAPGLWGDTITTVPVSPAQPPGPNPLPLGEIFGLSLFWVLVAAGIIAVSAALVIVGVRRHGRSRVRPSIPTSNEVSKAILLSLLVISSAQP